MMWTSVIFLMCAGLIMIGEIVAYLLYGKFNIQSFLGWACAGIWCVIAIWH